MAKMIKLTWFLDAVSLRGLYVNTDNILALYRDETLVFRDEAVALPGEGLVPGTLITMTEGRHWSVRETPEEILALMAEGALT